MITIQRSLAALAIAACLSACGQSGTPGAKVDKSANATPAPALTECLSANAEAFEALTEHAAAAPIASLESETAQTIASATACRQALTDAQASELAQIIHRLGAFKAAHDRTAFALSAVEGYRIFVSTQPRNVRDVPLEIALLDYAGFRYQASVRASPPLWSESGLALDFADAQWRAVSGQISDSRLASSFEADLAAMRNALQSSDAAAAQKAVTVELDHVDLLEQHFTPVVAK